MKQEDSTLTEASTRRLNLLLPSNLLDQMQMLANEQGTSLTELLRRFIKVGLLIYRLNNSDPENGLYLREGGKETKVILV